MIVHWQKMVTVWTAALANLCDDPLSPRKEIVKILYKIVGLPFDKKKREMIKNIYYRTT